MNNYKKLIELIKKNNLEIQAKECYDAASGWTGEELWIVDKTNYNKKIFDLSINGYCFEHDNVDEAIEKVEHYLESKNMETFSDFKNWVHKNKRGVTQRL